MSKVSQNTRDVSAQVQGASIVLEGVSFAYGNGHPALANVSLSMEPGEFVAILGANGSGKSTLAKHLDGLCIPQSGRVLVDERDSANPADLPYLRRRVGLLFQNPDDQTVASIVADDVAFGPENLGLDADEVDRRVEEALSLTSMKDFARANVNALSGGQRQLVALAGVLAMEPGALVLDEPGAMLDPEGRAQVLRIAHDQHARGMTVVLVTHFIEDAVGADRVVVMDRGRIVLEGSPDEVLVQAERLESLGLRAPFAAQLSVLLAQRGIDVSRVLDSEELEVGLCQLRSKM